MRKFLPHLLLCCTVLSADPTVWARESANPSQRILIDADTANEIDDLYAIVRVLLEPRFEVVGLNSAQWNHRLSPPNTVFLSQMLNLDILRLMNRQEIPAPLGAEMIMGKPWGGNEPSDSAAAQLIIQQAHQTGPEERLTVISLGAATNLASAIALAPEIVPKIRAYCLMGRFESEKGIWNKDEFNLRNDLNAANYLFDCGALELHVMPVNILFDFQFDREETLRRLQTRGGIWDYLAARWLTHSPSSSKWIMWDLALVEAVARPDLADESKVASPPENRPREIWAYTRVDVDGMMADWWNTVGVAQTNQ